jgi:hypothetical protein
MHFAWQGLQVGTLFVNIVFMMLTCQPSFTIDFAPCFVLHSNWCTTMSPTLLVALLVLPGKTSLRRQYTLKYPRCQRSYCSSDRMALKVWMSLRLKADRNRIWGSLTKLNLWTWSTGAGGPLEPKVTLKLYIKTKRAMVAKTQEPIVSTVSFGLQLGP